MVIKTDRLYNEFGGNWLRKSFIEGAWVCFNQFIISVLNKESHIPEPNDDFKPAIEILVDYIGLFNGDFKDKSKEQSISSFFESVLDGLVYQIVFPEEIKSAGKEILKHLGDLKPITNEMSEEKKLAIIQSEFERLYNPNHPVRIAIDTLDSVEEVRIIRGALK